MFTFRACDLCVYHYVNLEKEKFKADALETLKKVALQYLSRKNQTEEEIKNIEEAIPNEAGLQKEQFEFE